MLRQISNLRDQVMDEQLKYVVKHTFIEVRCPSFEDEDEHLTLKRQSSAPLFTSPTASPLEAYTATQDAKFNEDACSTCTEDALEVSTCASELGDIPSQKRSAFSGSSKSSWTSRMSQSSKCSIGSTASKLFQFRTSSTSKASDTKQDMLAMEVGAHCETISPVIVRGQESLESEVISELPIGTCFEIVELGEIPRRAKILAGTTLGWISTQTRSKQALIIKRERGLTTTVADFEVGGQHEVISTATLRAGESLDSEVIAELKPGTLVRIKELGQINNRRGKVDAQGQEWSGKGGMEGWISFTTRQGDFFIGKVSDKRCDKNASTRPLFGTGRTKIKSFLESARSGDLDAMKNIIDGTSGFMGKLAGRPNLNCSDIRGKTALIYASAFGNTEIVNYLLAKSEVDVCITDDTQKTALHHASKRAKKMRGKLGDDFRLQVVQALLEARAAVEARDHHGCTALMSAVGNCDEAVAKVLLEAGANVSARDYENHTPLDYAKHFGHQELADMLKAVGAEGEEREGLPLTAVAGYPAYAEDHQIESTPPFANGEERDGNGTPDEFERDTELAFERDNELKGDAVEKEPVEWGGAGSFSFADEPVPVDWQASCNQLLCVQPVPLQGPPGRWQAPTTAAQHVSTDATRCVPYMQPAETPTCSQYMVESYDASPTSMYDKSMMGERSWCQNNIVDHGAGESCGAGVMCELDQTRTTLMVGNLPQDLSQAGFVQDLLDSGYTGLFNFVYMPMNFRGQGNFGYAFVNFVSHHIAWNLMTQMKNPKYAESPGIQKWNIVWSNCQGYQANVDRYRNSPLMHELVPMECKPAVYDHLGLQVAFPPPTKTISKPRIHRSGPKPEKGESVQDEGAGRPARCKQRR